MCADNSAHDVVHNTNGGIVEERKKKKELQPLIRAPYTTSRATTKTTPSTLPFARRHSLQQNPSGAGAATAGVQLLESYNRMSRSYDGKAA